MSICVLGARNAQTAKELTVFTAEAGEAKQAAAQSDQHRQGLTRRAVERVAGLKRLTLEAERKQKFMVRVALRSLNYKRCRTVHCAGGFCWLDLDFLRESL